MGVYNAEITLIRALESILNQSYKNIQFIICNDASTDRSKEILNSYIKRFDNIILIENTSNQGLAKSLNNCLYLVSSDVEYIARMDADDFSHKDRIQNQVLFLNNNPTIDLVSCRVNLIENLTGKFIGTRGKSGLALKKDLLKGPPFIHPTIMIRSKSLKALTGYNDSSSYLRIEDYEFWFRFFKSKLTGFCLDEILFDYTVKPYMPSLSETINEVKLRRKYFKTLGFNFLLRFYSYKPLLRFIIPYKIKNFLSAFLR